MAENKSWDTNNTSKAGDFSNLTTGFNGWLKITSKLQGGTITNTAGVEVKNFAGWTSSITMGLKSDLVIGSYYFPASYKCTIGGDYSMQRGEKKDKSWGDKNEWRKGNISLRCLGVKKDFITQDENQFNLTNSVFNKLKKFDANYMSGASNFGTKIDAIVKDHNEIAKKINTTASDVEETAKKHQMTATNKMNIISMQTSIEAVNNIIGEAVTMKYSASLIKLNGVIKLGGVAIPNPTIATKVAAAEAARVAAEAKLSLLIAQAETKKAAILAAEATRQAAEQAKALADQSAAIARAV